MTTKKIKELLRNGPYAWPGGYPMYFITDDGEALSFKTVRDNWREVCWAVRNKDKWSGWRVIGYDINWESELYDGHTGEPIESAYGVYVEVE